MGRLFFKLANIINYKIINIDFHFAVYFFYFGQHRFCYPAKTLWYPIQSVDMYSTDFLMMHIFIPYTK